MKQFHCNEAIMTQKSSVYFIGEIEACGSVTYEKRHDSI